VENFQAMICHPNQRETMFTRTYMLFEQKKLGALAIMSVMSLAVAALPYLEFFLGKDAGSWQHNAVFRWLDGIDYFLWGWAIVFALAATSLGGLLYWKPGTRGTRLLLGAFSVIGTILASLWLLGLYFISNLKP